VEEEELFAKGQALEHQTEEKLRDSERHEDRHHILTVAVTLLHVAIAIATIAIIVRGQRWPWYAALALGAIGATGAAYAYIG
jgi:NhaP-type Na+/H+ or K+/H+ antiporter